LAGVETRVGYRSDARRLWLTDAPTPPPRTEHLATSYERLAARLAPGPADAALSVPRLHVSDAEQDAIQKSLRAAAITGAFAVVVPGAAFGPAKAWPEERFRELCGRLAGQLPVVVTGGPRDQMVCRQVSDGIRGVVDLCGQTSLGEFFALARAAAVVVANDSGAPHVSAALGTPTVVLFGSTSPAWTAPRGPAVAVLQHVVHCNPCFRRTCPTQLECFNGIAVDAVEARVRAFLEARTGRA
jgi:heptosyltransferase-2